MSGLGTLDRQARLAVAFRCCMQLLSESRANTAAATQAVGLRPLVVGKVVPSAPHAGANVVDEYALPAQDASATEDSALELPSTNSLAAYMGSIRHIQHLNPDEEIALFTRFRQGDVSARDALIRANLWLVPVVTRKYSGNGVSLEDLIEEGNLALFSALERFDPTRGVRFSTYAKWWVLKSATLARQRQAHAVTVPRGASSAKMNSLGVELERSELNCDSEPRSPDDERAGSTPSARPRQLIETVSIDDAQSQIDLKASESVERGFDSHIEQSAVIKQSIQALFVAVETLTDRERLVIEHRYELNGRQLMTLQEIAGICGVSAERIRKIQLEAMTKLRAHMFPNL
jgi:RNA polymerase nonessential primary-like sigma factor